MSTNEHGERCFCCNRPIRSNTPKIVQVKGEDTKVYVGSDCYRMIKAAGPNGFQPALGGPQLIVPQ